MKLALIGAGALSILVADATAQRRGGGDRMAIWKTLAERYDKDKDGKLTQQEYTRGEAKFSRWDANNDGVISAADFEGGGNRARGRNRGGGAGRGGGRGGNRGGGRGGSRMTTMVLTRLFATPADSNDDKKVTAAEWKTFCDKLDCDKNGIVSRDEMPNAETLNDRMFDMAVSATDTDKDGKMQLSEVVGIFAKLDTDKSGVISGAELATRGRGRGGRGRGGRNTRGSRPLEAGVPRPGEDAPDFDLPLADQPSGATSEATFKLSSFKGKKPVALIFGSYT